MKPSYKKSASDLKGLTLREVYSATNKADRYLAAMAGKEPQCQTEIKPKRSYVNSNAPNEGDVQKPIIEMLIKHPMVAWVERHNSGVMQKEGRYVRYHKVYKQKVRKADLDCQLKNGKRLVIEVKKPGWTKPTDEREREQAAYISMVQEFGGFGMFAVSVEQVIEMLERINHIGEISHGI